MASKFLKGALSTVFGLVHPKTGEILVSKKGLTPSTGMTGYKRNNRSWMGAIALVRPINTVLPAITGTTTSGQTLTSTTGTWTGTPTPTYTRAWYRDGVVIAGATAATYVLVAGDVGKRITVVVTATNTNGVVTATSLPTAVVA